MKNNHFWIDLLKSLAAFAVIILHISIPVVNDLASKENWLTGNFYESLTRFCVPIFVMVSGVLLLGKKMEISMFLRKRFLRLIFPFAFWSVIYLALKINYNLSLSEILSFSIKLLKEGTEFHLWYVYMIVGLYLIIPILNKWILNSTKKELIYFLSIWIFVILLDLPLINKLFTRIDLRYFTGYLGYLVLGYFLCHFVNLKKKFGLLLFIFGFLITFFATYFLSKNSLKIDGKYYNYLSINVVISSIGIFMIFKDYVVKNSIIVQSISLISKYSYGIYLSHILILLLFSKIGFTYQIFNPWFSIPLIGICCFSLSLMLTFLISKIPYFGKYISG